MRMCSGDTSCSGSEQQRTRWSILPVSSSFFFFPRPPEVSASGVTGVGQGGGPPLLCPAYLPHPVGITGAGFPGHTSAIHTRSVRGLATEGLGSRVS